MFEKLYIFPALDIPKYPVTKVIPTCNNLLFSNESEFYVLLRPISKRLIL